jgi:hypothetical protein
MKARTKIGNYSNSVHLLRYACAYLAQKSCDTVPLRNHKQYQLPVRSY